MANKAKIKSTAFELAGSMEGRADLCTNAELQRAFVQRLHESLHQPCSLHQSSLTNTLTVRHYCNYSNQQLQLLGALIALSSHFTEILNSIHNIFGSIEVHKALLHCSKHSHFSFHMYLIFQERLWSLWKLF